MFLYQKHKMLTYIAIVIVLCLGYFSAVPSILLSQNTLKVYFWKQYWNNNYSKSKQKQKNVHVELRERSLFMGGGKKVSFLSCKFNSFHTWAFWGGILNFYMNHEGNLKRVKWQKLRKQRGIPKIFSRCEGGTWNFSLIFDSKDPFPPAVNNDRILRG